MVEKKVDFFVLRSPRLQLRFLYFPSIIGAPFLSSLYRFVDRACFFASINNRKVSSHIKVLTVKVLM